VTRRSLASDPHLSRHKEKTMTIVSYEYEALRDFGTALGEKAGLAPDRAKTQAKILLEADLMGHTTHGFALLPGFLKSIETGAVRAAGEPKVISDRGSTVFWDADALPGTWILTKAIGEARQRAAQHGVVTVLLRNTSHIAALGAYLRQATDEGFVIIITNSDPSMRTVAPAGSREAQLAPNPLAFGYPTQDEPVLIDISTSSVANGWVRRWNAEGKRLPGKWLLDANGNPSDEPGALFGDPPGAMLPLGGTELGHKGFALGLIVEVLTAGLSGTGRADKPTGGGTPVFIQVIDPKAFAGVDALKREASWLAQACRSSKPRPGVGAVRMPGDTARSRRRAQLDSGVELYPSIMPELKIWANRFGITAPSDR
jgi:LDH2 family malate/lactate/ureidoglycolate dehydrogenase